MGYAGVVGHPKRLFITANDVMKIFGCKSSCASNVVKTVNDEAKKQGKRAFPAGKANKYLFSDIYGIPMDDIDAVMMADQGGDGGGVL